MQQGPRAGRAGPSVSADASRARPHAASPGSHVSWGLASCALLVLLLWLLAPIAPARVAPLWNADGFFVPCYTLAADFARAGRLVAWNPWIDAGSPDWMEPQVGAISPTTMLS